MRRKSNRIAGNAVLAALFAVAPYGVAGELSESAEDPSAFSTVIEARDYDERFATVAELLDQVPGVRVQRYGGLGSASTASIRGSKAEQVLVLVDGVRLNSAQRGAVNLSTIPLRQVERIEVLRGGGSARFGSGAEGGVIAITTRKPESADPAADASLSAGTYETLGGDLTLSGGGERGQALATFSRLRSDNDYRFEVEAPEFVPNPLPGQPVPIGTISHTRLNADFVENAGLLRGTLATGARSRLDATLDLYQKDGGEPGSTWAKPFFITDDPLSCTTSDESYERGLLRLGWSHERALGGAFEVAGAFRAEEDRLDDPAGACEFVNPLVTGGRDSAVIRESESSLDTRWVADPLSFDWVELGGRAASSLRYARVDSSDAEIHRRTTVLVSVASELSFFGGELRIFPALAFERADTSDGLARSAASQPLVEVSPRDENAWLPSVGAIWQLAPGLRAKANWKRVARRPTFTDLFHPDWGFIRGNPALLSERGWNADLGFELASRGVGPVRDLHFSADVFQREIDEGIEWMFTASNAFMPVNTGPTRALGFELGVGARLFERLQLGVGYTYTDTRYLGGTGSGAAFASGVERVFPHVPEDRVALSASLDLGPVEPWTEIRYESEVSYQVGNPTLAEAGFQVDAGVILRPQRVPGFEFLPPSVALSIEAANLNHEQRYDSIGQPLPNQTLWLVRLRGATP
ncbi:MAG: TonB-dependent receptor [Myxococcota bacterium]